MNAPSSAPARDLAPATDAAVDAARDLATPEGELAARRSLRAARARRAVALRARRLTRGRRAVAAAAAALAAFGTAGAVAHETRSSSSSSSRVVERGDRGGVVRELQRKLGLTADGVYGPRTRAAVRRFQRRNGLVVDGVAGPQTLGALGLTASRTAATRTKAAQPAASGSAAAVLARIAQCESGGNPRAVSPSGRYRGKYQFTRATWRDMGGKGDPARASEAEQDRLAAKLFAQRGTAPWPACSAG